MELSRSTQWRDRTRTLCEVSIICGTKPFRKPQSELLLYQLGPFQLRSGAPGNSGGLNGTTARSCANSAHFPAAGRPKRGRKSGRSPERSRGGQADVKRPNLPAKCESPVAQRRSVSPQPQQELALSHVTGLHHADWLLVKPRLAGVSGSCSFYKCWHFLEDFQELYCLFF